jgi:hypothetical protein
MEMVAFMERLPHSDSPPCTCPVIAAFVRGINDAMTDAERGRLLPYLPRLVATVSPAHEQARAEYLAWQAIKVFAPIALDAAFLHAHAKELREFDVTLGLEKASAWAAASAAESAVDFYDAWAAASAAAWAAESAAASAAESADAWAAASAAAWAAESAAERAAESAAVTNAMLSALDGVLAIGPQSRGFTQPDRVNELATLV